MDDTTPEDRAQQVIALLLRDDNPARRYRTVQALQAGMLRDTQAISLRQLRDQLGTSTAAADAAGISRQAANELLEKAGAPGARADRAARTQPTYRYGQYLGVVSVIADSLPPGDRRENAIMRWYDLDTKATQTTSIMPLVAETARKWLSQMRANGTKTHLSGLLHETEAAIIEWVAEREHDSWLSMQEQSEVRIGLHSMRVHLRGR